MGQRGCKPIPIEQRFDAKIAKTNGCWIWTGLRDKRGYGRINKGGKYGPMVSAHRFAYERASGPIPAGAFVCHHCDNPSCVNPGHLFIGTAADNSADCVRKRRHSRMVHPESTPRGESHYHSVLTETLVKDIRFRHASGVACRALARELGVSRTAVRLVIKRVTWRHIA